MQTATIDAVQVSTEMMKDGQGKGHAEIHIFDPEPFHTFDHFTGTCGIRCILERMPGGK